ncbi:hypothetical protein Dda_5188 [Drechslerella dactyloides]|uniref:FAD-binding PCMH-type domain-containing protein n=1 Tax=Drechslerella dactyloides TaxID=74499 RepID=A0AAD6IW49_DREDA|nr:hypothetical protein Dda_5188 [Drechslerella dactyloides]
MADLNAFSTGLKPRLSADVKIIGKDEIPKAWDEYCAAAPYAMVYPRTEEDVAETVKYCREKGLKCLAQSGGHSWRIKNSGDIDIIISLRELNTVTVAEDLKSATMGGGTLVGELINATSAKGVDVATGVCNSVGAVGSLLHGGIGRNIGRLGLGIDNLLSVNIVDATGKLHKNVTESCVEDLWWAIRGAGAALGIVTQATVKTHPQVNNGMSWAGVVFFTDDSKLEKLIQVIAETPLDENMAVGFLYMCAPPTNFQPAIMVAPWYYGTEEEGRKAWKNLLDLEPEIVQMGMMPSDKLNDCNDPFGDKGQRKPGIGMGIEKLDPATWRQTWDMYVKFVKENPEAGRSIVLVEAYPKTKVLSIAPDATLYANRDIKFEVIVVPWYEKETFDIKAISWANSVRELWSQKCGHPDGRNRVYPAFAGLNEPLESLYGKPERVEKLKAVKAKYDPDNYWNALLG